MEMEIQERGISVSVPVSAHRHRHHLPYIIYHFSFDSPSVTSLLLLIYYIHTHIYLHTHTHIFYLLFDRYLGYGDQDDLLRHLREHPESGGVGDFAVARRHDARLVWDLFYITADAGAGKFISLEVSNLGLWLFLYTAGFLFHVECCIGQLECSVIILQHHQHRL